MAGRGEAGSFPRRTLLEEQGWWRGWTPPHLPQAFSSSPGVVAGDAVAGGRRAVCSARSKDPWIHEDLWTNPVFRDMRLALGISGFPSPVKAGCREKLNEPYCKDFALKQKIFNTLGLSCWERSFPSVAVCGDAQGSLKRGFSWMFPGT